MTTDLFQIAKTYDKMYDGFKVDSFKADGIYSVRIRFVFFGDSTADSIIQSATHEFHQGFAHQIRPFGKCDLRDDIVQNRYQVDVYFCSYKITDVGVRTLLDKMLKFCGFLVSKYHIE